MGFGAGFFVSLRPAADRSLIFSVSLRPAADRSTVSYSAASARWLNGSESSSHTSTSASASSSIRVSS